MSRVRFHSIKAIFAKEDVEGIYTGPGWENWDTNKSCNENINQILGANNCDLVVAYKPLDPGIINFKEVKFRKCLRYNEMYDEEWTMHEITESGADLVVCHHYNDYKKYNLKNLTKPKFEWIPHSAEESIFFRNKLIPKRYDIGIMGAINITSILGDHYPLRRRMLGIIEKISDKYTCKVFPHVGYDHNDAFTDRYAKDFAKDINSCRIVITDSGKTNSRFAKYVEIPMCGTAIAGDLYDDHPDDVNNLKKFLIEISMKMTDEEIINKIKRYLEQPTLLDSVVSEGLKYTKSYTQKDYANRFVNKVLTQNN